MSARGAASCQKGTKQAKGKRKEVDVVPRKDFTGFLLPSPLLLSIYFAFNLNILGLRIQILPAISPVDQAGSLDGEGAGTIQ